MKNEEWRVSSENREKGKWLVIVIAIVMSIVVVFNSLMLCKKRKSVI